MGYKAIPDAELIWEVRQQGIDGWFTCGYFWQGPHSPDRIGEFVPIHHWKTKDAADYYVECIKQGMTRKEAVEMVKFETKG